MGKIPITLSEVYFYLPSKFDNSYLGKYYNYQSETSQFKAFIGACGKNSYYTLRTISLVAE